MSDYRNWKVFPPEELEDLKPGEEVIIRIVEWRDGKERIHFSERAFVSYSPYRGIVTVERGDAPYLETSYCEAAVGRSTIPEHYELHGDFSDEYDY